MKVLHAIPNLNAGEGGIAAALNIVSAQSRAGLAPALLLTQRQKTEKEQNVLQPDLQIFDIEDMERGKVDGYAILHIHGLWDRGLPHALRWATDRRLPIVLSPHGMLSDWALNQSKLKKKLYRRLVLDRAMPRGKRGLHVHYCTISEKKHSRGYWGNDQDETSSVISLSIDTQKIRNTLQDFDENDRSRRDFIFVGRIHPGKGIDHLIEALRMNSRHDFGVTVVGDFDHRFGRRLKAYSDREGIKNRVHWRGAVYPPKLYQEMANAKALVLPSDHENFGLVVAEAIACGTPALISSEVAIGSAMVDAGAAGWVSREPQVLGQQLWGWMNEKSDQLEIMRQRCVPACRKIDHMSVGFQWRSMYENL